MDTGVLLLVVVRFWIIQFAFAVVGFVLYYFTLYNDAV